MSNRSTQHFGGGQRPGLRSPRRGGGAIVLLAVFGVLASALPAMAAEIVEVRVGRHPTFTRVVFELDRAAGYRIERSDPSGDVAELIVSLEATSIPRSVSAKKTLIEQVQVEPAGPRSIARVRLAKDGLRLKEMILTSPPRIVLDVLSDAPPVAKTKPAAAPVEPEPAPAPAREPEPQPIVVAEAPEREPAPSREPMPVEPMEPEPTMAELSDDEALFEDDPQLTEEIRQAAGTIDLTRSNDETAAEADVQAMLDGMKVADAKPSVPSDMPSDTPPAEPALRKPRPMVAKPEPAQGVDFMTWALAGVGLIVLVAGGLFVMRRRGQGGAEEDSSEFFADVGDASADEQTNPFGSLDAETQEVPLAGPDAATASPLGEMEEEETTAMSFSVDEEEKEETESAGFGASQETGMDDMEVISREQVNESLGGTMPPVAGGVPEEFQQMMAEMQRRMEALESRCDELVDARDRLERQVAAQTEELRVQRAAIARTQRAVRNLGRPEEADEQEPTEPALRDPQ
jgi:hypothetical protein